jgi:hypothetical protein
MNMGAQAMDMAALVMVMSRVHRLQPSRVGLRGPTLGQAFCHRLFTQLQVAFDLQHQGGRGLELARIRVLPRILRLPAPFRTH